MSSLSLIVNLNDLNAQISASSNRSTREAEFKDLPRIENVMESIWVLISQEKTWVLVGKPMKIPIRNVMFRK